MVRYRLLPIALTFTVVAVLGVSPLPAEAKFVPPTQGVLPPGPNTDYQITGPFIGTTVTVLAPPVGAPFNPLAGYPATNPPGYTSITGFAGEIGVTPVAGQATAYLYCVDFNDETTNGVGYQLSNWGTIGVKFIGYIARIIQDNFPNNPASPGGLPTDALRAAAVQDAIWFFSDGVVVPTGDSLHAAVVGIVNAALAAGPLAGPSPASLQILPPSAHAPVGGVAGPFTLLSDSPAVVTVSGATLFSDPAGTSPIANGSTLQPGSQFFVRSPGGGPVSIVATGVATIPFANAYRYDNAMGPPPRQNLVLAQTARIRMRAFATAIFDPVPAPRLPKTGAQPR